VDNIPNNQVKSVNTITQREHEDNAAAKRVVIVNGDGSQIVDLVQRDDGKWAVAVDAIISVVVPPVTVSIDAFTATPDNILIVGTEDGTKTGIKRIFINNLRQQILATHDRIQAITYADFGTKNQRVTIIDYTSPTAFPGITARKALSYSLVGTRYRRDSIIWSIF